MEVIELKIGDQHTLVLEGRGTAGYGWSATIDDQKIVTIEPACTRSRYGDVTITGSRDQVFQIIACETGVAHIRFVLARPWEVDKPLATRDLEIVVR
jgi:predicted secreted protein